MSYIFLPKYGPDHPAEHGLVWCEYDGWVQGWFPTCADVYAMEHYGG